MIKDFSKEAFDIIIQAGQSNAESYGFGPVEEPYLPSEDVWYLNRNPLGWEDTIHFSRRAVYELGRRYFAAYMGLKKEN